MRTLFWFFIILMLVSGARKAPADELSSNLSGLIGSLFGQSLKPKKPPLPQKLAPLSGGVPDLTPWRVKPTPPQPQPRVVPSPLPHKKGERYA